MILPMLGLQFCLLMALKKLETRENLSILHNRIRIFYDFKSYTY